MSVLRIWRSWAPSIFLAERDGIEYEVEGKALPIFSGYPIQPQDAGKLFIVLRRKFGGWLDRSHIPILNVTIDGNYWPITALTFDWSRLAMTRSRSKAIQRSKTTRQCTSSEQSPTALRSQ